MRRRPKPEIGRENGAGDRRGRTERKAGMGGRIVREERGAGAGDQSGRRERKFGECWPLSECVRVREEGAQKRRQSGMSCLPETCRR